MDIAHRQQIRNWTHETLKILKQLILENKIAVEYNNKFTRRMGDAGKNRSIPKTYIVRFSAPLWPHATEEQRRETVVHEICHIVDMAEGTFNAKNAHGYTWSQLMIQCGFSPNRCHKVKRPQEMRNKVKRFEVKCGCATYQITSQQRTKIINKTMCYRCPKCKAPVNLVE